MLLVCLAWLAGGSAASARDAVPAHRVTFAFHSAFLMNAHHFLFDMAVHPDKLEQVAWADVPTADDMRVLRRAIAFYSANYASLGLRDDPALVEIKRRLSTDDDRRDATGLGLPPALAAMLNDVAPMYARTVWPRDDAFNRRWIANAHALDAAYGAQMQAGIERHLSARFPADPIRVDVVFDTGSRQGAYTDEQVIMPSARSEYQGLAALEMLYHEASHTTVTAPLEHALALRLEATGRDPDSELWHVVQFYTVGSVTRDVLARNGVTGDQPYADKRGLYQTVWAGFMPVIHTVWDRHLAGTIDFELAVRQMVDGLPAH